MDEDSSRLRVVGHAEIRVDAYDKVTDTGHFSADRLDANQLLHGKTLPRHG